MNDFQISADSQPFYLYIHPSKSEDSPETSSVLVKICREESSVRKPSLVPVQGSKSPEWKIPCGVEGFHHENGRIESGFLLKFHPESLHLASKNQEFAAQLRKAGLQALQKYLVEERGVSDFQLTPEPPLEHYRSLFLEKANSPRISQNRDAVVLLWSFSQNLPSCVTISGAIDRKDEALAELTVCLASGAPVGRFYCRAESGKTFGGLRTSRSTSGKSLSLQLEKMDSGELVFEESETEDDGGTCSGQFGGSWTHLYIGTSRDGLSLVTFPETRVLQTQAALQRSRDAGNRQRYARTRLHLQCRPMTLTSADNHSATVDISNFDPPVPLSILTELHQNSHSDGLSSSPDSVDSENAGDSGIGSDTSNKQRQKKNSNTEVPAFRNRSMSESGLRVKGILKHPPLLRSLSECAEEDSTLTGLRIDSYESSDNFTGSEGDELANSDGAAVLGRIRKKSVRFNEKVFEVCFRTNTSILGQRKKNAKKEKLGKKNKRRNSSGGEGSSSQKDTDPDFICGNYIPLSPSVDDVVFANSPPTFGSRPCSTIPEEKPPTEEAVKFGLWFDLMEPNHEPDQSMYDTTEPTVELAKKKEKKEQKKTDADILREANNTKKRQRQAANALGDQRYEGFVVNALSKKEDQSDSDPEEQRKPKEEDEGWQKVVSKRKKRGKRAGLIQRKSGSRESAEDSDLGIHLEGE